MDDRDPLFHAARAVGLSLSALCRQVCSTLGAKGVTTTEEAAEILSATAGDVRAGTMRDGTGILGEAFAALFERDAEVFRQEPIARRRR
jgi:hypothetical protein